jgi:hypothetical protein
LEIVKPGHYSFVTRALSTLNGVLIFWHIVCMSCIARGCRDANPFYYAIFVTRLFRDASLAVCERFQRIYQLDMVISILRIKNNLHMWLDLNLPLLRSRFNPDRYICTSGYCLLLNSLGANQVTIL